MFGSNLTLRLQFGRFGIRIRISTTFWKIKGSTPVMGVPPSVRHRPHLSLLCPCPWWRGTGHCFSLEWIRFSQFLYPPQSFSHLPGLWKLILVSDAWKSAYPSSVLWDTRNSPWVLPCPLSHALTLLNGKKKKKKSARFQTKLFKTVDLTLAVVTSSNVLFPHLENDSRSFHLDG